MCIYRKVGRVDVANTLVVPAWLPRPIVPKQPQRADVQCGDAELAERQARIKKVRDCDRIVQGQVEQEFVLLASRGEAHPVETCVPVGEIFGRIE